MRVAYLVHHQTYKMPKNAFRRPLGSGISVDFHFIDLWIRNIFVLGLRLSLALIIPILLFADDIFLAARTKEELQILLGIVLKYFKDHKMAISTTKAKLFISAPDKREISFIGDDEDSPLRLEIVSTFKYLGVRLGSQPYKMFTDFNSHISKKCDMFHHNILSLTKTRFERSFMAITMWKQIALPSLLYGTECIPLTQTTINKIETTQNKIGKFALQVPPSSCNLQVIIDAGLLPVRYVICQRVLQYANKLKNKPRHNLASVCYEIALKKNSDRFCQYVDSQLEMIHTSPYFPKKCRPRIKN